MPYKTFYVTQACEWKSNLFVPKSNDIHFAQPTTQQAPYSTADQQPTDEPDSRTILSSSQKALVLALPISPGRTFAGYEPACSIRLIVPRNMRILAKLTARRLTFEQEQFATSPASAFPAEASFSGGPSSANGLDSAMLSARSSQLWLNVSQNQFSETEQRIIETEGNVLAFRFLLERFANIQTPEIRFQVVLTAFQTFGENSDFNQPPVSIAWPSPQDGPSSSSSHQNAQFICDSQRLISANLACDGFKNCQDGHDEEPATCLALRNQHHHQHHSTTGLGGNEQLQAKNQARPTDLASNQQQRPWPTQLLNYLTRDLAGFLIGLLLILLLLVCCACCCHCLFVVVRRLTSGQTNADGL